MLAPNWARMMNVYLKERETMNLDVEIISINCGAILIVSIVQLTRFIASSSCNITTVIKNCA